MKSVHMIAWILLIVGGLNWLLVGVGAFMGSNLNVVNLLLGSWPSVESLVYILVGLSAVYALFTHTGVCRTCSSGMSSSM